MFEGDTRTVNVLMPGFMIPDLDVRLAEKGLVLDVLDQDDDEPVLAVQPSLDRLTQQERRIRVVAITLFVIFAVEFVAGITLLVTGIDVLAGVAFAMSISVAHNFVQAARTRNEHEDTYKAWKKAGLKW